MNKFFTRSRCLLVVVTLAMIAAMCTVSTVRAAPLTAGAFTASASPTAQCTFIPTKETCKSTDHTVLLDTYTYGDTADCIFTWDVYWGDGHSNLNLTQIAPSDGYHLLTQHTYANPNTYSIAVSGSATPGCQVQDNVHTFTLLAPPPPPDYHCSCVTYVRDTLAAQGINLGGGPATASEYTEKWMDAHGWHRVKLPNNGAVPDGNQPMVMVWDANTHGAGNAGHMAIVVNAWARKYLSASGKSPWYNHNVKRWNITVLQDDWSEDPINCTPAQHLFNNAYQHWGELYGVNFYVPDK
jgi:hypothetical protein